jgi:hypothetical protein
VWGREQIDCSNHKSFKGQALKDDLKLIILHVEFVI